MRYIVDDPFRVHLTRFRALFKEELPNELVKVCPSLQRIIYAEQGKGTSWIRFLWQPTTDGEGVQLHSILRADYDQIANAYDLHKDRHWNKWHPQAFEELFPLRSVHLRERYDLQFCDYPEEDEWDEYS